VEDELEVFDINFVRLREKQCRCSHPSTKCSVCGKHHDLLKEEDRQLIVNMALHIKELETLLDDNRVVFFSIKGKKMYDRIKVLIDIPVCLCDFRYSEKKHCEAEQY
jgi:hypothetical protein